MPRRMRRLRCLQKLPLLVLGERTPYEGWGRVAQLEEIRALKNVKGDLFIQVRIPADARYVLKNGQQGGYLSEHQRLTRITFRFPSSNFDEALLEDLQPHPSLKDLKLEGYCGKRMPYWARKEHLAIFLPNLVSFYLQSCHKLQHLAVLGRLPKLEFLRLEDLPDLEYIEDTTMSKHSGVVGAWKSEESFFPSLEELELWGLPKLKGWSGDGSNTNQRHGLLLPSFPCLSHLRIEYCPNLACVPLCPRIEVLTIVDCNANLQIVQDIESGNPDYEVWKLTERDISN
ncbi:hypothetical protein Cgig2_018018 [Carnegiea gigantea]|uniref:R13L1/DRL21-like LRR repeat region domain-containing protein n=1 Tax=Carnegiea gigantea TaxID=171969 RepID=A0A9Q1GP15_9CARY|nr:hypothetical protein Cgig2_018018 [Carnegiea gigantea]